MKRWSGVRLTKNPVRMPEGSGMPTVLYKDPDTGELKEREGRPNRDPVEYFREGVTVDTLEGAAPGMEGNILGGIPG